jgi:hypothetical protein
MAQRTSIAWHSRIDFIPIRIGRQSCTCGTLHCDGPVSARISMAGQVEMPRSTTTGASRCGCGATARCATSLSPGSPARPRSVASTARQSTSASDRVVGRTTRDQGGHVPPVPATPPPNALSNARVNSLRQSCGSRPMPAAPTRPLPLANRLHNSSAPYGLASGARTLTV